MDFLKRKFNEELLAEIEDKNVNIAGSSFTAYSILKDMDPDGYNNAFSEWCNQRKEEFLMKADEIMGLHDNRGRFIQLRNSYRNGAIIPFIGAGMSIPSGYPGWTEFLWKLRNETRVSKEKLKDLLSQGQYEEAVQALADDMPAGSFDEAIENDFGPDKHLEGPIQLLPSIFNSSVITTNLDNVTKRCYDDAVLSFSETLLGADDRELPRYLGQGNRVLVKLHGKANSSRNRVLTYLEYEEHYGNPPCLQNAIEAISTKKTLLFLGCSLVVDRTIQALTQLVEDKGHDATIRHYAFLSISEAEDRLARRDNLAKANIFPIWYPADEDHNECIEALFYKLTEGV